MKTTTSKVVHDLLAELNKTNLWKTNIRQIGSALCKSVRCTGYAVVSYHGNKQNIEHFKGITKRSLSQKLKRDKKLLAFTFDTENKNYRIYLFGQEHNITSTQCDEMRQLLSILSEALSMRQASKERIIETQIINQLNLYVITSLDEYMIVKNLESAARRMLAIEDIYLFHLKDAKLIGSEKVLDITDFPKNIYDKLFRMRQVFTTKNVPKIFLNKSLESKNNKESTIVPFTIKNELRGFFVIFDNILGAKRNLAITRIKFLANQASLALGRIDLIHAMNRALRESKNLQDLIKMMLSSLDLFSLFNEILQRAQKLLGFKRILFSLYDPETKCFTRVTGVGISAKKLRTAKSIKPPLKIVKKLLNDRYRISNSYYISSQAIKKIGSKVREYELFKPPPYKLRFAKIWDPGDIFISPIYSKNNELVAMLSLDTPITNLVPSVEKAKLLEAFGYFLGLAIENTQLFEKIEKISNTDEMTGVYNYRFLREQLNSLINEDTSPISLIMIDLDNFKKYNDQYGHLYGDEILKVFSKNLVNMVNNNGYVIRYGGDEFIVLSPGKDLTFCKNLMNRICRHARKHKIIKGKIPIEFSYGIAVYPDHGYNLGDLIDYADKQLYQQKTLKKTCA